MTYGLTSPTPDIHSGYTTSRSTSDNHTDTHIPKVRRGDFVESRQQNTHILGTRHRVRVDDPTVIRVWRIGGVAERSLYIEPLRVDLLGAQQHIVCVNKPRHMSCSKFFQESSPDVIGCGDSGRRLHECPVSGVGPRDSPFTYSAVGAGIVSLVPRRSHQRRKTRVCRTVRRCGHGVGIGQVRQSR